jgi:non-canonical purine NTP pyrophosphatase (RdgB/HAM1 family)
MQTIIFATSNDGKVKSLQRRFERLGVEGFKITKRTLDLIEPQAVSSTEVAKYKAKQAFDVMQKPILVDDSSFHISALGGFPGPFIKYMLETIGIEGILSFMNGKEDRSAYFLSTLVYIDESGNEHVFEDEPYYGVITNKIEDYESTKAWSKLSKIFIPTGSDKVLALMTDEDHARIDEKITNSYEKFCIWLKERS